MRAMPTDTVHAPTLTSLLDHLRSRRAAGERLTYHVPTLWRPLGRGTPPAEAATVRVNPYDFLLEHVEAILHAPPAAAPAKDWVKDAVIYNMFVRLATAWDHDGNGKLGRMGKAGLTPEEATCNAEGTRETGTFLKALTLLGHIRSLGCNALHLLPVTSVGKFGNKGNLGSPYAIRNPYALEETLRDPLVDLDVSTQFKALVEACHLLGIKVIVEFVFRTSSRDGDWVGEHPEWYYWIKREIEDRPRGKKPDDPHYYGLPPFTASQLKKLKEKVAARDLHQLPAPPQWYQDLFTAPPDKKTLKKEADGRWTGTTPKGQKVHVPSAFADWPPDDFQPPWTDVTYLRVYNESPKYNFNYIAYNTIRMYDDRLATEANANRPLWDAIRGILPHYQKEYGIDGCMVDMGHALPGALMKEIIDESRKQNKNFALLSENFVVDKHSVETGYNAVLGYEFTIAGKAAEMRKMIERCCVDGLPIAMFGTPETHNTPRAAMRGRGPRFCRTLWLLNCFMADTIPFIHNGFELADDRPVNLGLAFTPEELEKLGGSELALFDAASLEWDHDASLVADLARISELRQEYRKAAKANGKDSFAWFEAGHPDIIAFGRTAPGVPLLFFVLNWSPEPQTFRLELGTLVGSAVRDLVSGQTLHGYGHGIFEGRLEGSDGMLLIGV
jgi:hypothetical protein